MSEAPAWETCKENVLPVKRGRSAKGLSEALAKPVLDDGSEAAERDRLFESQLSACSEQDPMSKLNIYIQHIKWFRDAFPGSSDKVFALLERCTVDLKDVEELKNDAKLVTLWIEYADSVRTPGEIFTFMDKNKIGARLSLFWVAWAYVAEKAQNYKLTDQIFVKGTRRQAEPKDLLAKRYKQFQRRMARQFLNGETLSGGSDCASSTGSGETINEAIVAAAMTAIRNAPSVVPGSSSGPSSGSGFAAAPAPAGAKRRALSSIEGEQGLPIAPPAASVEHPRAHPPHRTAASSASSSSHRSSAAPPATGSVRPGAGKPPSKNTAPFQIFSDAPTPGAGPPVASTARGAALAAVAPHLFEPQLDDRAEGPQGAAFAPTWGTLGTEASRRKENDGPVTKWSQGPLLPASSAASSISPPLAPLGPVIPIFVDPEFEREDSGAAPTAPAPAPASVLSVRRQLDPLESMARHPLARHTQPAAPPVPQPAATELPSAPAELPVFIAAAPPPVPSVVAPTAKQTLRPAQPAVQASKTAAGFSIFCDATPPAPAMTLKRPQSAAVARFPPAAARSSSFTVFEPGSAQGTPRSPCVPPPAPTKVSTPIASSPAPAAVKEIGFSIFVDESFQAPITAAPAPAAAPFAIYESPARQPPPPAKGAFAIYADEPPVQATAKPAPAFQIFEDVSLSQAPAAPALSASTSAHTNNTNTSNEEEQDRELHAILDNMMCLDSEDGTINTRLAKRDIDMMFCSPTIHRVPPPATTRPAPLTAATAPRPPPGAFMDENSFVLRREDQAFERALFRGTDAEDGDSEVDQDELCSSFIGVMPPRTARKPLQEQSTSEPSEACTGSFPRAQPSGLLQKALHRPFGVQLAAGDGTMSAVKDLSAIKESSQEFSLCGTLLETPGHTGTLGFGRRPLPYATTGRESHCGGMLADITDMSHPGRDSFGGPIPGRTASGLGPSTASKAAGGFEIFCDPSPDSAEGAAPVNRGYYYGIDADAALPLPRRRRLYTPFSPGTTAQPAASWPPAVAPIRSDSQSTVTDRRAESQQHKQEAGPNPEQSSLRKRQRPYSQSQESPCQHSAAPSSGRTMAEDAGQGLSPTVSAAKPAGLEPVAAEVLSAPVVTVHSESDTAASATELLTGRNGSGVVLATSQTKTVTFEADLFYDLEPDTVEAMLAQLRANRTGTGSGRFQIAHHPQQQHPACFNFRAKPNTSALTTLPHCAASQGWAVQANIGRGTYGHAILLRASDGERRVFKVDTDRDSVLWEAFIHLLIQGRLRSLDDSEAAALHCAYCQYVLAPTALLVYSRSAVLQLPFCRWGTLVTALSVLAKRRNAFSTQEHEALCAYLSFQMLEAVLAIHSVGVLHCDIKTDNWVLSSCADGTHMVDESTSQATASATISSRSSDGGDEQQRATLTVRLIDFGRALSACEVKAEAANLPAKHGSEQVRVLTMLYGTRLDRSAADALYRGDVSCKGYQCLEMQRGMPWSYQNDFHGLCSCIHQLLHLQPLACSLERADTLWRRGIDVESTLARLRGDLLQAASPNLTWLAPMGSLKRYWNKALWSTVYVLLLNGKAAAADGAQQSGREGAVRVLTAVRDALRQHLSEAAAAAQRAVAKLVAELRTLEI